MSVSSDNGHYLAGLCGASEKACLLACWSWGTHHLLTHARCSMAAHSLSPHPSDSRQWCVCGARSVATFSLSDAGQDLTRRNVKINVSSSSPLAA